MYKMELLAAAVRGFILLTIFAKVPPRLWQLLWIRLTKNPHVHLKDKKYLPRFNYVTKFSKVSFLSISIFICHIYLTPFSFCQLAFTI